MWCAAGEGGFNAHKAVLLGQSHQGVDGVIDQTKGLGLPALLGTTSKSSSIGSGRSRLCSTLPLARSITRMPQQPWGSPPLQSIFEGEAGELQPTQLGETHHSAAARKGKAAHKTEQSAQWLEALLLDPPKLAGAGIEQPELAWYQRGEWGMVSPVAVMEPVKCAPPHRLPGVIAPLVAMLPVLQAVAKVISSF